MVIIVKVWDTIVTLMNFYKNYAQNQAHSKKNVAI